MQRLRVKVGDRWFTVEVEDANARPLRVMVEGELFEVEIDEAGQATATPAPLRPVSNIKGRTPAASGLVPNDEGVITSPMHGKIVGILVKPGDVLQPGAEIALIEAMKMEQTIRLSKGGKVRAVHVQPGQQVKAGDPLMEIDTA